MVRMFESFAMENGGCLNWAGSNNCSEGFIVVWQKGWKFSRLCFCEFVGDFLIVLAD